MSTDTDGAALDIDDPFDVYDHPSDPFVGEAVLVTTPSEQLCGVVERAIIRTEGDQPVVELARPDGKTARVPWAIVDEIDSRVSLRTYGCPACGAFSDDCYRCSECGKELTGDAPAVGREHGGEP